MAHYRIIDTASWPRRDHFTFYRQFANPSFNLCVPIAAQRLYECAKDRRVSFFQLALYALLRAANGVPQLRQRVRNDEVIEYDSPSGDYVKQYEGIPEDGVLAQSDKNAK